MSQGDPTALGPVAPCHTCRHTAYYGSCPECGGGKGYPAPPAVPTVGPCQACRLKIADEPPPMTPVEQLLTTADNRKAWEVKTAELLASLKALAQRDPKRALDVAAQSLALSKQVLKAMGGK